MDDIRIINVMTDGTYKLHEAQSTNVPSMMDAILGGSVVYIRPWESDVELYYSELPSSGHRKVTGYLQGKPIYGSVCLAKWNYISGYKPLDSQEIAEFTRRTAELIEQVAVGDKK